jgi:hypothetical protein
MSLNTCLLFHLQELANALVQLPHLTSVTLSGQVFRAAQHTNHLVATLLRGVAAGRLQLQRLVVEHNVAVSQNTVRRWQLMVAPAVAPLMALMARPGAGGMSLSGCAVDVVADACLIAYPMCLVMQQDACDYIPTRACVAHCS